MPPLLRTKPGAARIAASPSPGDPYPRPTRPAPWGGDGLAFPRARACPQPQRGLTCRRGAEPAAGDRRHPGAPRRVQGVRSRPARATPKGGCSCTLKSPHAGSNKRYGAGGEAEGAGQPWSGQEPRLQRWGRAESAVNSSLIFDGGIEWQHRGSVGGTGAGPGNSGSVAWLQSLVLLLRPAENGQS